MWRVILFLGVAWGQVVFVAEVCRHGSRAPITLFPWDSDGRWSIGPGELTTVGMRQHFLLGAELRQRYVVSDPVLMPVYNYSEVYFRSTDVNRTILSAQSQLMGLFPAGSGPKLPLEQAFTAVPPITVQNQNDIISSLDSKAVIYQQQPLPIHVVPNDEDLVLHPDDACPLLRQNIQTVKNSAAFQQAASSNPEVLQTIQNLLGATPSEAAANATAVIEDLICNEAMAYALPEEITPAFLQNATTVFNALFAMPYQSDQNARLFSSGFFQELSGLLQNVAAGTEKSRFRLYSAHDTTVAGLLAGLQVYDNTQPPFASTLIFEVFIKNYGLYVDVKYNDKTLAIPGCQSPCPISAFISFLQGRTYPDLETVCQGSRSKGFLSC